MNDENKNENKFVDFDFNKVIKNKPQAKVITPTVEVEEKKVKVEEKVVKKVMTNYKIGKIEFKNLNDLQNYLLINYHKIDKIATKLLNDHQFRKWLQSIANDEDSYNEWLNKIL